MGHHICGPHYRYRYDRTKLFPSLKVRLQKLEQELSRVGVMSAKWTNRADRKDLQVTVFNAGANVSSTDQVWNMTTVPQCVRNFDFYYIQWWLGLIHQDRLLGWRRVPHRLPVHFTFAFPDLDDCQLHLVCENRRGLDSIYPVRRSSQ